jgi:hypothetical protein
MQEPAMQAPLGTEVPVQAPLGTEVQAPLGTEVPVQALPEVQAPAMQAPSSCPPCLAEGEKKEEGFFSKFSPKNLNDKLVEAQDKAIENGKNSLKTAVVTKKAELADAITGFLKPNVQAAGRRTKRKRSSTKRSSTKRSSKKRSTKKRSSTKRSSKKRRTSTKKRSSTKRR